MVATDHITTTEVVAELKYGGPPNFRRTFLIGREDQGLTPMPAGTVKGVTIKGFVTLSWNLYSSRWTHWNSYLTRSDDKALTDNMTSTVLAACREVHDEPLTKVESFAALLKTHQSDHETAAEKYQREIEKADGWYAKALDSVREMFQQEEAT